MNPANDFEWVNVSDLVPAKYNPRDIADENFQGLRASIRQFGILDALVVNRNNKTIVGGHRRLDAAILEGKTLVPVRWCELTPAQEALANLVLNNPKIQGHFTKDVFSVIDYITTLDPTLNLEELRASAIDLKDLVVNIDLDNWTSDIDAITKVNEHDRGMYDEVTIAFLKGVPIDEVKTKIAAALEGIDFDFR